MIPALTVDFLLNALTGAAMPAKAESGEAPLAVFAEALETATAEIEENSEKPPETKPTVEEEQPTLPQQQPEQLRQQLPWLPFANVQIVPATPAPVSPDAVPESATEVRQEPQKSVTILTTRLATQLPQLEPQLKEAVAPETTATAEVQPAPGIATAPLAGEQVEAEAPEALSLGPAEEATIALPDIEGTMPQLPAEQPATAAKRSLAVAPKTHVRWEAEDPELAAAPSSVPVPPVTSALPSAALTVPVGTQIVRPQTEANIPDKVLTVLSGAEAQGEPKAQGETAAPHAPATAAATVDPAEPPRVAAFSGVVRRTTESEDTSVPEPRPQPQAKEFSHVIGEAPQLSARTTGDTRTQQASGKEPVRETTPVPETPTSQPPAQAVTLRLGAGTNERIDVQLQQRGGEMHMAVRTDSPEMAHKLRTELPELSQSFGESGFRAEIRTSSQSSDGETARDRHGSHQLYDGENGQGRQRRQSKQEQEDDQFSN